MLINRLLQEDSNRSYLGAALFLDPRYTLHDHIHLIHPTTEEDIKELICDMAKKSTLNEKTQQGESTTQEGGYGNCYTVPMCIAPTHSLDNYVMTTCLLLC